MKVGTKERQAVNSPDSLGEDFGKGMVITMSTYKELYRNSCTLLKNRKIEDAELDAWYLLSYVFQMNRTAYLIYGDEEADEEKGRHYMKLITLRAEHIPLQYITGTQEFMGLEFRVTPDVLIPRQDTEILVEEVLKNCDSKMVLDMCTGSGCIIISTARLGKPGRTVGVDISPEALTVARDNAVSLGVNTQFIQSNLFEKVEGNYDIIISNPPYIPTKDIDNLMPEVKNHEPVLALDGDKDGLYFYREIAVQSKKHFEQNGQLFLEIGYDQGEAVREILSREGYTDINIKKDLSGHDRVVTARYIL